VGERRTLVTAIIEIDDEVSKVLRTACGFRNRVPPRRAAARLRCLDHDIVGARILMSHQGRSGQPGFMLSGEDGPGQKKARTAGKNAARRDTGWLIGKLLSTLERRRSLSRFSGKVNGI